LRRLSCLIIKVRPYAKFRSVLGKQYDLELKDSSTVRDLLEALPISRDVIFDREGLKDDVNLMVCGKNVDSLEGLDTVLKDGDELVIFSAAIGG
jgi:sulfur-carrier protein